METQVAVITGASRGIGRATALALAKEGMAIIIDYLSSEVEARQLEREINQFSRAVAIRADVADSEQVKILLDKTLSAFGRIDVLVNNAGAILRPGDWQNMTHDTWHLTHDINLLGAFNCIKQFASVFLDRKKGKS